MKIGVIQASSQTGKNELLYDATKRYAEGHEVVNFGCFPEETGKYSYIEISLEIGALIASRALDFIVTGCSSGQGMMLACNSIPGIICGYAPTPMDAYLFAQINNGNVISLPLGEGYTFTGEQNCERTIEKLFSETFGQGYPKQDAERKLRDTKLLKDLRNNSQINFISFMKKADAELVEHALQRQNVLDYISTNGEDRQVSDWVLNRAGYR